LTGGQFRKQWRFFKSPSGKNVAKEELLSLPVDAQAAMTDLMRRVERGQTVLAREVRAVADGLTELRVSLAHNEYRCLFCHDGRFSQVMIALTFLVKKQERLPKADLDRARQRMADWKSR
jgi:phage-related protein